MGVDVRTALTVVLAALTASKAVLSLDTEGGVRLVGADNTALQGLVEVYHEGLWLSVCADPWDTRIGDVVCRQLGFSAGAMSTYRGTGQGGSGTWLTGATCAGDEDSLTECQDVSYGTDTCSHSNDAGVRCAYPMYLGCYSSNSVSPLVGYSSQSPGTDIAQCLSVCRGRGYAFAGVRAGHTCTCGDTTPAAGKLGNSACNLPCSGDEDEICGGTTSSSIYRTVDDFYNAVDGGYVTSPNFPSPYTAADATTHHVQIPTEANYAVVVFSHFELAAGDELTLRAAGAPGGTYSGGSDVPDIWISMSAATSFTVSFTVAAGSAGDTGFALQFKFGELCQREALPVSVTNGRFTASKNNYYYGEKVVVNCDAGYQRDRDGFVCQLDGSWSEPPVCSVVPTIPPPPPTTDAYVSTDEPGTTTEADNEATSDGDITQSGIPPTRLAVSTLPPLPCPVPEVADGTVDSEERDAVWAGDTVTLTCHDSFVPADGNSTATCLDTGQFDVGLVCSPEDGGLPVWLISIIVVAAVLAIIVIVLIFLLMIVSSGDKQRRRHRRRSPPPYADDISDIRDNRLDNRLVAIPASTHLGHSSGNSVISGSEDGGTVNQGAQTDADPALGDLGDPMVGDNDVYHPTRDYPGAGRPGGANASPRRPAPVSPPLAGPLPRQRSVDYNGGPADFSMLPSEELLAVRALDNVVSDFERGDQAYYLGPSGPSPYNMDRGSRYGSRQVQFSQRSRLSSFYGLY